MAKTFETPIEAQNYIESLCTVAVKRACDRLLGHLQEIIDEKYYDEYMPTEYKRTDQFWRSAMTKMLSANCGQIFMDASAMNYGEFWSGEIQLKMANEGFHGSFDIQTDGRFFESFVSFCEKNAVKILREELARVGIKTS